MAASLGVVSLCVGLVFAVGLAEADVPAVTDRAPQVTEVGFLPGGGSAPEVNPPALAWLAEEKAADYIVEISPARTFSDARTIRATGVPYTLYTHTSALEPGWYYWRYAYRTAEGETSQWSKVRKFRVSAEAVKFPRPDPAVVRERLSVGHPRLFIQPDEVDALRRAAQGPLRERWEQLKGHADQALKREVMREPPGFTNGKWNATEWRRDYGAVVRGCNTVELLAFAYLISGEKTYAARAREWLLQIASWNPRGSTSIAINDEAGMPILHITSRAYSWIHDALSEADRDAMRSMMRQRGAEAYKRLHGRGYEQRAYDSHAGRMWHFLGEAAIAYWGEIPEAEKWLDYVLAIFWGWYPAWGDEDGGWAEGMGYWTSYMGRVTWWLDALRSAIGVDGARKPFFSETGNFALYFAQPNSPISGFGDSGERAAIPETGAVVNYLADAVGNQYWKWYAEQWKRAQYDDTPIGFLRAWRMKPTASRPPSDLPLSRVFRGVGWAAFHTDLINAGQNVQLHFRSSPTGNFSHAHCDQNAIVIAAYGEPLLVNTGIRPWYGSEFSKRYYWTTQSHNAILIGGEGQPRLKAARGHITAFRDLGEWAFVEGDAASAYPNARSVVRRILFLRPDVFVIHDHIETPEPLKCQFLLHARAPFVIEAGQPCITLTRRRASLAAQFVAPEHAAISQTDRYPLEPEMGKPAAEWHLTAESQSPSTVHDFVVVLAVARAGQPFPVSDIERVGALGLRFRWHGRSVSLTWAPDGRTSLKPRHHATAIRAHDGLVRALLEMNE
jgi:hypothetical protein